MNGTRKILTITLATVLPVVAVLLLACCLCHRQKRKSAVFKRGATPIDDDEIESWRVDKGDEKIALPETQSSSHNRYTSKSSTGSLRKPPSVVIYHNRTRASSDSPSLSPRSLHYLNGSVDLPAAAVFARAPNSRPGLTDEVVKGDDAYVPSPKRQQMRSAKGNSTLSRHDRSRSSRSSTSIGLTHDQWYSQSTDDQSSPRHSAESSPKSGSAQRMSHHRVYSTPDNLQHHFYEDDILPGGLSPRPVVHKSEIGRAIG